MKILDYSIMKAEIINRIKEQRCIVLATSDKGRVTARTVYCTSNGLKIYFITSSAYTKYKQIANNPRVAMCFSNVQIQGSAAILGHPSSDANAEILKACAHIEQAFMHWAKYKNAVLIEVNITGVECWNNNGREYLDVQNEKSYRIG